MVDIFSTIRLMHRNMRGDMYSPRMHFTRKVKYIGKIYHNLKYNVKLWEMCVLKVLKYYLFLEFNKNLLLRFYTMEEIININNSHII